MKPQFEVVDILRKYGDEYRKDHAMTADQRKVMAAIQACRTSLLGGHQEVCDQCGHIRNCYNSCRNRHCPKCQTLAKKQWLDKRREELLPCGYFHIHCLIPAGVLSIDGTHWIASKDDFFSMSSPWRTKTMVLPATEFIRRFLLHVLPHRFMKIRYFVFLANNFKDKAILLIRGLIGKAMVVVSFAKETIREKMLRLTGNDVLLCPHCRQGTMIFQALLQADSS